MVIRYPYGQRNPLLEMAEVTRSLLSLTAVSGRPTTAILSVFPPSGMDFDLDLKRLDSDDRRRIDLGWHNRTRYSFILITFARNVLI
jgi:hypothetical protein